jgi:DtxR family Mn-dependent transcriptional regulator
VVRRHEALRNFLVKVLSVEEHDADEAACRMEHATSPAILERLVEFVDFLEKCPRFGPEWIDGFGYRCGLRASDKCEQCIAACQEEVVKRKTMTRDKNARSGTGNASGRQ